MQRPTTTAPNRRFRTNAEPTGCHIDGMNNPMDIGDQGQSDSSGDTEAMEAVLALEEAAHAQAHCATKAPSISNESGDIGDWSYDFDNFDDGLSAQSFSVLSSSSSNMEDSDVDDDDIVWDVNSWDNIGPNQFYDPPATKWKQERQQYFKGFEDHTYALLAALVQWETVDANKHRQCSGLACTNQPTFRCFSCASIHSSSHFCNNCAVLHQWSNRCHHLRNAADKPPLPRNTGSSGSIRLPEIVCCSQASEAGRTMKIHSLTGSETIRIKRCKDHSHGDLCVLLLQEHGFFPSRIRNTSHAFSINLLSLALKLRRLGTAYQIAAEAFFGTAFKDAKRSGLYQPFMDAVRQLAVLRHHQHHGLFSEEMVEELGLGQTVCPACIGGADASTPAIFNMDGFESANKKSEEQGGSGSHGCFRYTSMLFKVPTVKNYVEEAKRCGNRVPVVGCESQHRAGTESLSTNGKDVSRIVHVGCATHSVIHRIYDVPFGGEPLWYADDIVAWGLEMFRKRAFVLGYDVACKELSHLRAHNQFENIIEKTLFILFIPAMHVYAHGKGCQCLFSPRQIHGLGKTIDGEGVERFNSHLSPSIGLTQQETAENRHMDIANVTDQYNQSKIRGLVSWTVSKLVGTFAELENIRHTVRGDWKAVMESDYDSVVKETTNLRQELLGELEQDAGTSKQTLRMQIDDLARTVLAIDKHLKRGPGTKMASRLKNALSTTFASIYHKLREYNDIEPKEDPPLKFATVKSELMLVPNEFGPNQVKAVITVYWRHLEDLYHHRNCLKNMIGYYKDRLENHWNVILTRLESVENISTVEAWKEVVRKRIHVELEYTQHAESSLGIFSEADNVLLFKEEHLDQIHNAFISKNSVLSFQNLKHCQRIQ